MARVLPGRTIQTRPILANTCRRPCMYLPAITTCWLRGASTYWFPTSRDFAVSLVSASREVLAMDRFRHARAASAALATATVASFLGVPAVAHADTSAFLGELHAAGFQLSDSDLIPIGEGICDHLRDGYSIVALQQAWEQELIPKGYTAQQAIWLVNGSRSSLCPTTGRFD